MEIERKFLLKSMPDTSGALRKEIEQGYLCSEPVVRIRKSNENYILTYKSKLGLSQNFAIQNEEVEMPLTKEAYEHLREKIDGNSSLYDVGQKKKIKLRFSGLGTSGHIY